MFPLLQTEWLMCSLVSCSAPRAWSLSALYGNNQRGARSSKSYQGPTEHSRAVSTGHFYTALDVFFHWYVPCALYLFTSEIVRVWFPCIFISPHHTYLMTHAHAHAHTHTHTHAGLTSGDASSWWEGKSAVTSNLSGGGGGACRGASVGVSAVLPCHHADSMYVMWSCGCLCVSCICSCLDDGGFPCLTVAECANIPCNNLLQCA